MRNENEAAWFGFKWVFDCSMRAFQEHLMGNGALVAVVDDDVSVRESLPDFLRQLGYAEEAFASAEEFLDSGAAANAKCLILDIGLPGMSGPDLQRELIRQGYSIPTIFITGRSDRSIPPGMLQAPDVACLFKPFSEQDLQSALEIALRKTRP
jgi:FixJ family two-component response regulator